MCCPGKFLNQKVAIFNEVVEEYNQTLDEYRSLYDQYASSFDAFEAVMQSSRQGCAVVTADSLDKQAEVDAVEQ